MTAKEFFELVVEIVTVSFVKTNALMKYFYTRDRNYLQKSKKLEKQVNDEIRSAFSDCK